MTTVMFDKRNDKPVMVSDSRVTRTKVDSPEEFHTKCKSKICQFNNYLFGFAGKAELIPEFIAWWQKSQFTGYYTPSKSIFRFTDVMGSFGSIALEVLVYNPITGTVEYFQCNRASTFGLFVALLFGKSSKLLNMFSPFKYCRATQHENTSGPIFIGSGARTAMKTYDALDTFIPKGLLTNKKFYNIIFKVTSEYDVGTNSDIKIRTIDENEDEIIIIPV